MNTKHHKKNINNNLKIGILSISTTRTIDNDESGHWIKKRAIKEGHEVIFYQVIPDNAEVITKALNDSITENNPNAVILTGGTGISPKDLTIEAVRPMFEKELTAFGAIFGYLSFEEIDSAAILSRATAGIIGKTIIFCIPGSLKACKLACKAIIFPEINHIINHIYE